jgi:hypothetical protein
MLTYSIGRGHGRTDAPYLVKSDFAKALLVGSRRDASRSREAIAQEYEVWSLAMIDLPELHVRPKERLQP